MNGRMRLTCSYTLYSHTFPLSLQSVTLVLRHVMSRIDWMGHIMIGA
jgi:hypothetical protein